AHAAIALGTYFGGWRIVHTMGQKITKLRPVGGFCAESAGAITLFGTALAGIPVSTTHTITGAIVGVGATQRFAAVRWGIAGRIVYAWILTIPMAPAIGAIAYGILLAVTSGIRATCPPVFVGRDVTLGDCPSGPCFQCCSRSWCLLPATPPRRRV